MWWLSGRNGCAFSEAREYLRAKLAGRLLRARVVSIRRSRGDFVNLDDPLTLDGELFEALRKFFVTQQSKLPARLYIC